MARFFKRTGSEVVEIISEERTASPNIWWSPEQLTIHGFKEVSSLEKQAEIDVTAEKEKLISAKIREQAISALKTEGKLDQSGEIPKKKM